MKRLSKGFGKLNWISENKQARNIILQIRDARTTKFQNATVTDAIKVNKVIKTLNKTEIEGVKQGRFYFLLTQTITVFPYTGTPQKISV